MLILHGIAAYALLLVAGALIPVHIKVGWSIRRNLLSGLAVVVVLAVLGLTALALYYCKLGMRARLEPASALGARTRDPAGADPDSRDPRPARHSAASKVSAPPRSTETSRLTPFSIMVTP